MCIMFVYINNDPTSEAYQLIVVNNRDEHYKRPTKPADFWEHCQHCISGLDQEPGRENGTWFGVSRQGKVGSLLNILTPYDPPPHKKGRGNLVCGYLQAPESAQTYLDNIKDTGALYNAFSLVLLEKQEPGDWKLWYYSNTDVDDERVKTFSDGIHGFSNSVVEKPFQKVTYGKKLFSDIVGQCGRPADREQLVLQLTNLMTDTHSCLPDSQLLAQSRDFLNDRLMRERSCIFVDSSHIAYGTRTTTILLVEQQGNCEYIERTMQEPIDPQKPTWSTTDHCFTLVHPACAKI